MKHATYEISVCHHTAHLIDVCITVHHPSTQQQFMLPVWTPGSYLVREYARHVRDIRASQGEHACAVHKVDKSTWEVEASADAPLVLSYRVYAYELSVRTNHLDDTHAFFNPAAVCMHVQGVTSALDVFVDVPVSWHVATQLPLRNAPQHHQSFDRWSFCAETYDALVDAPFECGSHRILTFTVAEIPHYVVIWGHGNEDAHVLVRDIERAVRAVMAHFATIPYQHYYFILHLADGMYGGLEHSASTVCLCDKWGFARQRDYERILGLITHEFYHTWNVKSIRPAPLGPFNYAKENYTRQLWLVEGVTSYYDNLIMCRAGMISPQRYLELLADDISTVQRLPGRHVQSLADASFDAWIRYYRPDENSPNVSVSYYVKGAVVAFALDVLVRTLSQGRVSLDHVMRHLESTFPWTQPGIPEDDTVQRIIATCLGGHQQHIDAFFEKYIYGYTELDYELLLATIGLYPHWHTAEDPATSLGVVVRQDGTRLIVATVAPDGPAATAGISPFDELIAINGARIDQQRLKARLNELHAGDAVTVTYFRRDELRTTTCHVAQTQPAHLSLVPLPNQTDEQLRAYQHWLSMPVWEI